MNEERGTLELLKKYKNENAFNLESRQLKQMYRLYKYFVVVFTQPHQ